MLENTEIMSVTYIEPPYGMIFLVSSALQKIAKLCFCCHGEIYFLILETNFADCLPGEAERCVWNRKLKKVFYVVGIAQVWRLTFSEVIQEMADQRQSVFMRLRSTRKVSAAFTVIEDTDSQNMICWKSVF